MIRLLAFNFFYPDRLSFALLNTSRTRIQLTAARREQIRNDSEGLGSAELPEYIATSKLAESARLTAREHEDARAQGTAMGRAHLVFSSADSNETSHKQGRSASNQY